MPLTLHLPQANRTPLFIDWILFVLMESKGLVSGESWSSGTKIQISIRGNYEEAKAKILRYFVRIIFTAHVKPADGRPPVAADTFDSGVYGTSEMPRLPSLIKPHPSRVDVTHLQLRLAKTQEGTLFNFLQDEFAGIDDSVAKELYLNLGEGVRPDRPVERLKGNTRHFYEQLGKIRFKGLSGDVSSPIGKAALSDGVKRLLKGEPQMLEFFYGRSTNIRNSRIADACMLSPLMVPSRISPHGNVWKLHQFEVSR